MNNIEAIELALFVMVKINREDGDRDFLRYTEVEELSHAIDALEQAVIEAKNQQDWFVQWKTWETEANRLDKLNRELTEKANRELIRNARLEEANQELLKMLVDMIEMFKDTPTLEQFAYDEPSEPRSQWDYDAILMIGDARATIEKVKAV